MKTLKLAKPWTYRTPAKTVGYPAGSHEVAADIYAKALAEGVITEEKNDGGGARATGSKGSPDQTEE